MREQQATDICKPGGKDHLQLSETQDCPYSM